MPNNNVTATARILREHRKDIYIASLPNGKEITAFIPPKKIPVDLPAFLEPNTAVTVQLALYDFSCGMILGLAQP